VRKDGTTRRKSIEDILEKVPNAINHANGELLANSLVPVCLVPGTEYLFSWFADLCGSRPNYGFGPTRITYCELEAWASLNRIRPEPWEVKALRAMDSAWLSAFEELKKEDG